MSVGTESSSSAAYQAVFLFTDIADSVVLKRAMGDEAYLQILKRHNELFERAVGDGGRIVSGTGDGFLAEYQTCADAVRAALRFQSLISAEQWGDAAIRVRCALHSGMAMPVRGAHGEANLSGLAVDMAARVMGLAIPGQILLTRQVFDDARQYVREHADAEDAGLEWRAHGPYLFKGVDETIEVYEVGLRGIAPLRPPPDAEKARRAVPAGEEEMYDWRPATGLQVPRRAGWHLERKLGEGGFGEVWLGVNRRTSERRVFKFCFDVERLRSFKRELTLFRLLRVALGSRGDIARLHEVNLERPPFYLESEYSAEGDLGAWAERQGGIRTVPLDVRLDLLARTADAVAAAHSVGVLHKDLKPGNILIEIGEDGRPRPQLSDFGIGVLADRSQLEGRNITVAGFTVSQLTENERSRTGTRMYAPPEQLSRERHGAFTAQGDVYALGVLLYQFVVGDLGRPIAEGWERDLDAEIKDADERVILKADIAEMIDGDPARRTPTAAMVAERVRSLGARVERARREAAERLAREAAEQRARESELRRKRTRRAGVVGGVVLGSLLGVTGVFLWRERGLRAVAQQRSKELEKVSEFQSKLLAGINVPAMSQRLRADLLDEVERSARASGKSDDEAKNARARAQSALDGTNMSNVALDTLDRAIFQDSIASVRKQFLDQPVVEASLLQTIAESLRKLGLLDRAMAVQDEVLALRTKHLGAEHLDTLGSLNTRGHILHMQGRFEESLKVFERAAEALGRRYGPEHSESLSAMNNVAAALESLGRYDEAEPLYAKVLEAHRRINGEDNPETLIAINNMGSLMMSRGRYSEAEKYYRDCMERSRRVLGDEHPDTLLSISNMGDVLLALGKLPEAEKCAREALDGRRRVLGDEHLHTLISVSNMGAVLTQMGRSSEAGAYYKEALDSRRRVLGEDHPETLLSLNNYASFLDATGRAEEAGRMYREALERRRRVLGPEHPDTLESMSNLASFLDMSGEHEAGAALSRQTLTLRERILGPEHQQTLTTRGNLAEALRSMGEFEEAESLARIVLDAQTRLLGKEHVDTLLAQHNVASVLQDEGKSAEARAVYETVIEARRRVLGAEHPDTLSSINNLAIILRADGELDRAEKLGREVAAAARKLYPGANANKATLISGHAQSLVELKRFKEGEMEMLEAYQSAKDASGPNSGDARSIVELLVSMYEAWDAAEPGAGFGAKAEMWRAPAKE